METEKSSALTELFDKSNSFLVLLPPDPSFDMLSGALSLYLSLKNSGKKKAQPWGKLGE